ncbi:Restriction endonuclease [compost metagenome]
MNLNASQIADKILLYLKSTKSIKLYNAIERAIQDDGPKLHISEVSDLADNYLARVRNQLNKRLKRWEEQRLHPQFRWGEIDNDIIFSFFEQGLINGEEPDDAKYRLTEDLKDLLRNSDPIVFEKLGQKLLEFIGAESFTTRSSKDEGIDFGGIIKVIPPKGQRDFKITERVIQNLTLRLVGQAKRYRNDITVNEIRELLGTGHVNIIANLVRKHSQETVVQKISDYSLPLIYMFITTSDFSRDASNLASHVGMITMNGTQISQALLHMGIACKRNAQGRWEVDEKELDNWLKS